MACLWRHARRFAFKEEEVAEIWNGESTAPKSIADCGQEHVQQKTQEDTNHRFIRGTEKNSLLKLNIKVHEYVSMSTHSYNHRTTSFSKDLRRFPIKTKSLENTITTSQILLQKCHMLRNILAMKHSLGPKIKIIEVAKTRQDLADHANHGTVKGTRNLTKIRDKSIMEHMELTTIAETLTVRILFGAILQTEINDGNIATQKKK